MPTLNERMQEILQAVVEDYIETAEPVGSRSLTKRNRGLDMSPATVRKPHRQTHIRASRERRCAALPVCQFLFQLSTIGRA